ncbi:filamentous hemagglutinin N-terminal domain-containing protein [Aetokthonos hydrillicola Thurmond2011]|jgi:filamentous hemagglutinin family protein|uniref:Filamentous hemagglutinin N-terminal domain-containing protein n=1 Tax=Aetokthonos hydrillicola Thurmond2011 TaxID=2712845 RepID=A0AAP5I295_9CYAN|nr:filamentous hemagglutinin N-terminal domain-containing protein [Aetokthonos hydrillicola]MBO3457504.1 filamentous hemagglutinin N-terminal domain-containing protein [Aetokthonos hydrillicola CCALA 1050]MBW4585973.1 filamentous hemagglutinin N-terminal domain-containing protein [Aetokthonos hydrillicola CCALA 1050]MDR9893798.1 filamentous hemagglutinin N-terminal domain-containing protein [Aetokthonos hydrillicola Thurmond2011]
MKQVVSKTLTIGTLSLCCIFTNNNFAQAQISADNTVQTNVSRVGNVFEITGGTKAGGNLFHSFVEFSVPTGNTAFFNNSLDISNIISRVTGNSISSIDGLIRANGGANLILINPNGINFGSNAQLNIGGSFLASTANSVKFADGGEFSAVNPQTSPLIIVSVPVGLQLGKNSSAINVQGTGHSLTAADNLPINRGTSSTGLRVQPGKTLALVGGNINIDGGTLTAERGRIELGGVAEGLVRLNPTLSGWALGYDGVSSFKDIEMRSLSSADASGTSGGSIQVQGQNLLVSGGSLFLIQNQGTQPAGAININTSDSVKLSGTNANGTIKSSLTSETVGTGRGGDINVSTKRLTVEGGGSIEAKTFTPATGGNINVNASQSGQITGKNSQISTDNYGAGIGGDLMIGTGNLIINNGGFLSSTTFGAGKGGNITVRASNSAEFTGTGFKEYEQTFQVNVLNGTITPFDRGTGIESVTAGSGSSGDITIETPSLLLNNGAVVFSPTFTTGKGGDINISNSKSVEVIGSALETGTAVGSTGSAGNIKINTGQLIVRDGGVVINATFADGAGGNVDIKASDSVQLLNSLADALLLTGIYTNTSLGKGKGGDVRIDTKQLNIRDAVIGSNTGALLPTGVIPIGGSGGNLFITADSIDVSGVPANTRFTSGIGSTTYSNSNAGNLTISTKNFIVRDGADIATNSLGSGDAGTLSVNASESIQLSGIKVNGLTLGGLFAASGRANLPDLNATGASGNIKLATDQLIVQNGATIDVRSIGKGNAGNLEIQANSVKLDNQGTLSASTTSGEGGNISIKTNTLQMRHGSQILAQAGGTGNGGNINITRFTLPNSVLLLEGSKINANAFQGRGGNIQIDTNGLFACSDCQISASSQLGFSGIVRIITPEIEKNAEVINLPEEIIKPEQIVAQICPANRAQHENKFTITGRGGLPPQPDDPLSSETLLSFESSPTQAQSLSNSALATSETNTPKLPPPARGWYVNSKGTVILTSRVPKPIPYNSRLTSISCRS